MANNHQEPVSATALDEALYEKYIRPTQRPRSSLVGVEFELPVVNLSGQAVSFRTVHEMTEEFVRRFPFDTLHRDDEGEIYAAVRSGNGDTLSMTAATTRWSFPSERKGICIRLKTASAPIIPPFSPCCNNPDTA